MGKLRAKATECTDKEIDRMLKEKFINSINNQMMTTEIIKGLIIIKDTSKTTKKQVQY